MIRNFLKKDDASPFRAAIFLSGTGTNAARILERRMREKSSPWEPVAIVTDRPASAASDLARRFSLPLIEHDIAAFYRTYGMDRVSLASSDGIRIRGLWTDALRPLLAPYRIDFGIFAGFVPLTNIVSDFPCLNVHPGDLLVEENGRRVLVGLHTVPVEAALKRGLPHLRSSVLVLSSFDPAVKNVDGGFLLSVSAPVPVEWSDAMRREIAAAAAARTGRTRSGFRDDALGRFAGMYLERLKADGDWIVFPRTVEDFAAGRFAYDDATGEVYYDGVRVRAVEYRSGHEPRRITENE